MVTGSSIGCRSRIFFSCGERKPSSLDTMESEIIVEGIVSTFFSKKVR